MRESNSGSPRNLLLLRHAAATSRFQVRQHAHTDSKREQPPSNRKTDHV